MFVIKNDCTNEIIIKNSRFITFLIKINNLEQIQFNLEKLKKDYPKATHYCYAYIINDIKKASDDKEPSGTAGIPILNVLEKENLTNILCVVIRYFGGIKLGAGGLVRAYNKSVVTALDKVDKISLVSGFKLIIEFDYANEKELNYLLNDSTIINKEFQDKIKYTILVDNITYKKLLTMDCIIIFTETTFIEEKK